MEILTTYLSYKKEYPELITNIRKYFTSSKKKS